MLITKKNQNAKIEKNIGRIFRKYNIIEYKSPEDYLSIDDYYKVYGYACFFKSETGRTNEIELEDITITFVFNHFPHKLMKHLKSKRHLQVINVEKGIYYIDGELFPIQLIHNNELSEESNFWLKHLTNNLIGTETPKKLLQRYDNNKNNKLYDSIMDVIVRANPQKFERKDEIMCDALLELMKDKLEEKSLEAREEGLMAGRLEVFIQLILDLLEELGNIPENLVQLISSQKDPDVLSLWHKKAAKAESIEAFQKAISIQRH